MATTFNKKELERKREQKKKDKQQRKEERKASGSRSFDDMIAYVDEYGVITNTPPDPTKIKRKVKLEDIAVSTPKQEEMEDEELKGRVDFFNPDKGFGFIKTPSGMDKYFFHISNAFANIAEGNMVTFELERGERGMNAVKVALVK